ncbi:MAG: hypothetical protein KGL52_11100 [Rhodospirillales bacterium]|jgi:hypothetical protein|nr:hypothetical protein [Rhodospirillales bacterium]
MLRPAPQADQEVGLSAQPTARFYLLMFLLAAAMQMLASAGNFVHVWHGMLVDPDSYMRLVRIEQGLKLGHLVNTVAGRDDSGATLVIEWSRLFDAALVALAAPLSPWLGWHKALYWAGVASSPLAAGSLGVGLSFAVAPLVPRGWLWSAAGLAPLLAGIHGFEAIGVIHYHIVMVSATAITAGLAVRATGAVGRAAGCVVPRPARVGDGFATGLAGGMAIWIMPETMPFVLLCFLGLGWCWMFRPIGRGVAAGGLGFLATLAFGLWRDPPAGGLWAPELDRLSVVYAALGVAVAAVGLWLWGLDRTRLTLRWRWTLGIGGALIGFAVWLGAFPSVALGPYALLPADQMRLFFGEMMETQPVRGLGPTALLLGPGAFALAVAATRAWSARHAVETAGAWLIVTAAALLALGLTARFKLFAPFPTALGAAMLPLALADASRHFAARPQHAMLARIGLVATLLVAPYAAAILGNLLAAPKPGSAHAADAPSCAMTHIGSLLGPAAGQIVLSRIGEVPELLYRSRIVAVGSLYQHGVQGYLRARAAWRAPASGSAPPAAVAATGARFVLFCPRGSPYVIAKGAGADALWFALSHDRPPSWLRLVGAQQATGFRLYRIVPPPGG